MSQRWSSLMRNTTFGGCDVLAAGCWTGRAMAPISSPEQTPRSRLALLGRSRTPDWALVMGVPNVAEGLRNGKVEGQMVCRNSVRQRQFSPRGARTLAIRLTRHLAFCWIQGQQTSVISLASTSTDP